MVEPARGPLGLMRLKVALIRIRQIWTRPPGSGTALAVDPGSFESAEPDAWVAFTGEVIRHLNEHHHDELLELARASGATECTAASIARLDSGGAILTAMSRDGLLGVVVPFQPPAATSGEANRRLTRNPC